MTIPVDTPGIQIILYKLTGLAYGQAYRGFSTAIDYLDLAQFLGDAGTVRTTKSIYEPAGGWTISFADKNSNEGGDTVYALVEPMDMVEIRMKRIPRTPLGGQLPLIMRGFVSSVERVETINPDGSPNRVVVLQGQDMGKLWLIHQLLPEIIKAKGREYLEKFSLLASQEIAARYWPVSELVREFTEGVMNARVAELTGISGVQVPPFTVDATVPEGIVSPALLQPFKGKYWEFIETIADRPWNEAWVEDFEDGPVLHFRPAPFRDLGGGMILPGAAEPGTIERDSEDIVKLDVRRTDHRVANFFWVPPGTSSLHTNNMTSIGSLYDGSQLDEGYGNNNPTLFGLRKMEAHSRLLPGALSETPIRYPPGGPRYAAGRETTTWHQYRATQLKLLNRDNVALEEVTMILKGHEDFRPGRYYRITRGQRRGSGLVTEQYAINIAHTFAPLRTWTTTVTCIRGDGFLVRDETAANPYWLEGRAGPYTRR